MISPKSLHIFSDKYNRMWSKVLKCTLSWNVRAKTENHLRKHRAGEQYYVYRPPLKYWNAARDLQIKSLLGHKNHRTWSRFLLQHSIHGSSVSVPACKMHLVQWTAYSSRSWNNSARQGFALWGSSTKMVCKLLCIQCTINCAYNQFDSNPKNNLFRI